MTNTMLHTKAEVLRENVKEDGIIDAIVGSTAVIDRMGDVITQDGWDLKNYTKNPVILWGHNVRDDRPPIGKAIKVWLDGKQQRTKKLMFKVKFDLEDSFAAEIFRKIKDGFVNTVSVGFLPTEWEALSEKDGPFGGRKYTKQELLELSFVPVPANPEAVVALRSMSKEDKRFTPIELKDAYPQIKDEESKKEDMPKEENPKEKAEGDVCDMEDGTEGTMQMNEDGEMECMKAKKEKIEEEKLDEKPIEVIVEDKVEKPEENKELHKEEIKEEAIEEVLLEEKPVIPVSESKPIKEEEIPIVVEATESEKTVEVEKKDKDTVEEDMSLYKGVISFKDLGILPESETWDGPGEEAKADAETLKIICAWFDNESPDNKASYKLPHHKAEGHKAVWRGVAAAMASLLGARGGLNVSDEDRKGIYNHLKKHYIQFDKEIPDYKMVEDQVLAKLDNEIHALSLDREDKYAVKLIKKVLKKQNENKTDYSSGQVKQALNIIDLALSLYKKSHK